DFPCKASAIVWIILVRCNFHVLCNSTVVGETTEERYLQAVKILVDNLRGTSSDDLFDILFAIEITTFENLGFAAGNVNHRCAAQETTRLEKGKPFLQSSRTLWVSCDN